MLRFQPSSPRPRYYRLAFDHRGYCRRRQADRTGRGTFGGGVRGAWHGADPGQLCLRRANHPRACDRRTRCAARVSQPRSARAPRATADHGRDRGACHGTGAVVGRPVGPRLRRSRATSLRSAPRVSIPFGSCVKSERRDVLAPQDPNAGSLTKTPRPFPANQRQSARRRHRAPVSTGYGCEHGRARRSAP